jgi:hypothetical protein
MRKQIFCENRNAEGGCGGETLKVVVVVRRGTPKVS